MEIAKDLVVGEGEEMIYAKRTDGGSAELVLLQGLHVFGEVVAGVESVVAEELVYGYV